MAKLPDTEKTSIYEDIHKMSTSEILSNINREDAKVAAAVREELSAIEALIVAAYQRMKKGGRLFYIGSGTSGRLGIVDASECPPTFGVSPDLVVGIIAGGDGAIRHAVEHAEDDAAQAWKDIATYLPDQNDTIIGIAASGTTPYVIGGIKEARENGLLTGSICCSANTPLSDVTEYPIEVKVGPEFITGSTRMKSGTAQKMVLNMISTTLMVKLGRVKGNKMVNMQLTNNKLKHRGARMISESLGVDMEQAEKWLLEYGSVQAVLSKKRQ